MQYWTYISFYNGAAYETITTSSEKQERHFATIHILKSFGNTAGVEEGNEWTEQLQLNTGSLHTQ